MPQRPVIGICTALERARWSVWDQQAALLPNNYLDAIRRAGGMALMLAPDPALTANPDEALDLLDGLMLAGGADIDPASYGAERHAETIETVPERDAFELALTRRAIERDLPLLGICRGMQLLNVALGGSLYQDLRTQRPDTHDHESGHYDRHVHRVSFAEDGLMGGWFGGRPDGRVVSIHHQGVHRLGRDMVVEAVSSDDGVVEAIRWNGGSFVCGVQWHPEFHGQSGHDLLDCSPLLEAFLAAAQNRLPDL